ncbi:MAG: hypothetical protein HY833_01965 [Candidatus Aenigmarchaeota archaeon]|nr:hypothetical protein [Candidatus Aenigmarchaeota archaeon]
MSMASNHQRNRFRNSVNYLRQVESLFGDTFHYDRAQIENFLDDQDGTQRLEQDLTTRNTGGSSLSENRRRFHVGQYREAFGRDGSRARRIGRSVATKMASYGSHTVGVVFGAVGVLAGLAYTAGIDYTSPSPVYHRIFEQTIQDYVTPALQTFGRHALDVVAGAGIFYMAGRVARRVVSNRFGSNRGP